MRPSALLVLALAACGGPTADDAPVDATDDTDARDTDHTDPHETDETDAPDTDDTDPPLPRDDDNDGSPADLDCDDADPGVFPGAPETCDGRDEDCSGLVDDLPSPPRWRLDRDGDGYGDAGFVWVGCAAPPAYVPDLGDEDCEDLDPAVFPGAEEVPGDGVDGDCDGVEACFPDLDLDGFGSGLPAPGLGLSCTAPYESANDQDCDDGDVFVFPRAPERCGAVDRDCDGRAGDLDDDAVDAATWFRDADADGAGNPGLTTEACLRPVGHVADALDCDDTDPDRRPGAEEVCNGIDDDCDGFTDDQDPDLVRPPRWYRDGDRDGAGDPDRVIARCERIAPFDAPRGDDCNDDLAAVRPGAQESVGNALDENCDGRLGCFVDADLDGLPGYATGSVEGTTCDVPGFGFSAGDCDDTNPEIQQFRYWADGDRDGWGNAAQSLLACQRPAFFTDRPGDCDDTRPEVRPDATELPGTGRDEDCDGTELCWADVDRDGLGGTTTVVSPDPTCTAPGESTASTDCDDTDPEVRPGKVEGIGDGVDQDCDGRELCFVDADTDGWGGRTFVAVTGLSCALVGVSSEPGDCDDQDPSTHPGAAERCGGGDENCNGLEDDADPALAGAPLWHADADADGLGDPGSPLPACVAPDGFVADASDCADHLPAWGRTCPWREVAAGDGLTCGLRTDGAVSCVGAVEGSVPSRAETLAVSGFGGCALVEGRPTCFGPPDDPRLGAPDVALVLIAAGPDAACGLDPAGAIHCWGSPGDPVPLAAPLGEGWSTLAVGDGYACALRADGTPNCWGAPPCAIDPSVGDTVAVGLDEVCTLDRGALACTACGGSEAPTEPLLRFDALAADEAGTCALTVSGDAACWAGTLPGRVGDRLVSLDVGTAQACAVDQAGVVACWGEDPVPLPGP